MDSIREHREKRPGHSYTYKILPTAAPELPASTQHLGFPSHEGKEDLQEPLHIKQTRPLRTCEQTQ